MEQSVIAVLLEKYWQAETTVEEEKVLAAYFRGENIPPEWEVYRAVFSYYAEEARLVTSADFDKQVLERIGAVDRTEHVQPEVRVRSLSRSAPWWAAAAVILLSIGAALMTGHPVTPTGTLPAATQLSSTTIRDTYDDPQQALDAIRKALFKASSKISTGRSITKKELQHFNKLQYALSY